MLNKSLSIGSLDIPHTVKKEKCSSFQRGVDITTCKCNYICSVIENSKVALQMEYSFRYGNKAAANQQIKFSTLMMKPCTLSLWRNGYDIGVVIDQSRFLASTVNLYSCLLGRRQANLCFHFAGSGENLPDITKSRDASLHNKI